MNVTFKGTEYVYVRDGCATYSALCKSVDPVTLKRADRGPFYPTICVSRGEVKWESET